MRTFTVTAFTLLSFCAMGQSATDYYNKAVDECNSKDYKAAIADYTTAVKLNPKFAEAYYNRGTAKVYIEDYKGAILDYDKAIGIDSEYTNAYKNRGSARIKINDLEGALGDFDKVIRTEPGNTSAYFLRGQVKLQQDKLESGCGDLAKAYELGEKRAQKLIDQYCGKYAARNGEKANESLKLDWPDAEGWKVGSNQRDDERGVVELLRNNETFDNWTELGTMMIYPVPPAVGKLPVEVAMNAMWEQAKKTCPGAKLTFIEKNETQKYPWIIFKIECDATPPESQVWQIILGTNQMFVNFRAIRQKTIPDDLKLNWTAFFKTAEVIAQ